MTKIKAVLDQETWVEVDVPDEFQAIVTSLFSSVALDSESTNVQDNMTTYDEVASSNDTASGRLENSHQQTEQTSANEVIRVNSTQVNSISAEANGRSKAEDSSVQNNSSSNVKERGKSTSQTLSYGGVSYHMVNWLVLSRHTFVPF